MIVIIAIDKVQSRCDSEVCNEVCHEWTLNGTCVGDECDCSTDTKCIDLACDKACDLFDLHLEGECNDYGYCTCKPKLEPCLPTECQTQCEEDPRALECLYVVADFCLWYGPVRTCGCICYTWYNRFIKFNHYKSSKVGMLSAKKSIEFLRKYYSVVPAQ